MTTYVADVYQDSNRPYEDSMNVEQETDGLDCSSPEDDFPTEDNNASTDGGARDDIKVTPNLY